MTEVRESRVASNLRDDVHILSETRGIEGVKGSKGKRKEGPRRARLCSSGNEMAPMICRIRCRAFTGVHKKNYFYVELAVS